MLSPQTLAEADRRLVAIWAADCAERVLPLFEADAHGVGGARDGIDRARAFGRGELDAAGQIRVRFVAGRAARAASAPAAVAAARSAGQAAGVAHMGAHALGAAAYAARAAGISSVNARAGRLAEVDWQLAWLTADAAAALDRLPALGADASGPLGPGLLATGDLGETIRALQRGIARRVASG